MTMYGTKYGTKYMKKSTMKKMSLDFNRYQVLKDNVHHNIIDFVFFGLKSPAANIRFIIIGALLEEIDDY